MPGRRIGLVRSMPWLGPKPSLPAARVVSLVPSLTESVRRLGAGVVGRTSYCPELDAQVVGGPKDVGAEPVLALAPDVVLASRSENARTTVEVLAERCPMWLCDPVAPVEAPGIWRELGDIVGRGQQAARAAQATEAALEQAHAVGERGRVRFACWLWRDPWIVAGPGCWISGVLEATGFRNAAPAHDYPRIADPTTVIADLHLFPSEPYGFARSDLGVFGEARSLEEPGWFAVGGTFAVLVPGEDLIWYPSHAVEGLALAQRLRAQLDRLNR